jgi:predicted ATPase
MAQQPFLKSIRPVNLLSFGPNTEEIELRPLNILIGPNGSGKSNLIEIIGLLSGLPDKDPWTRVRETGGAPEWIWKGSDGQGKPPSLSVVTTPEKVSVGRAFSGYVGEKSLFYALTLRKRDGAFELVTERLREVDEGEDGMLAALGAFERDGRTGLIHTAGWPEDSPELVGNLSLDRSVLSMLGNMANIVMHQPRLREFADDVERLAFYRDWVFGAGFVARNPISAGQPVERLKEDASNLAQVLARYQSDFRPVFDKLNELMKQFYEPIKAVEVRIVSTHLQVAILEEGGFSIPAYRLSDGTLRWLALLSILLNPTPAPVTCIEEPELGLHPDMIPTLSDLLRDASTRTQLILTTHSQSLVECFSDDPESVCVCEKLEGATQIRRLSKEKLSSWLEDYSLGQLWAKGEIGGNRW